MNGGGYRAWPIVSKESRLLSHNAGNFFKEFLRAAAVTTAVASWTSDSSSAGALTVWGEPVPATVRAAVIAGYLHVPEGRRDHTTPAETLRPHRLG
jgi:hypothetical protein